MRSLDRARWPPFPGAPAAARIAGSVAGGDSPALLQLHLHGGQFGGNGAAVGIHQNAERVVEAVEPSRAHDWLIGDREQSRAERQQVARQVPAVHRGNVDGLQRLQGLRVVPVEKVAPVPFQPVHRVEGIGGALGELAGRDVPEIVGRQIRQQGKPDIGGRGAVRDARHRMLLIVVGRQPVVFGSDEGLKEVPGLAGELAQEDGLFARSDAPRAAARAG